MTRFIRRLAQVLIALGLLFVATLAAAASNLIDINPSSSDLDPSDPLGASGGRINGLASVAGDNDIFYAATEWGGIYKSTDGGLTWSFLAGHRSLATWDVEVDPSDSQQVYATSFFDGRQQTVAGINVSSNGGSTWTRPATATPPAGFNCAASAITEPSAFGIGVRPDASNNVFVGTNCGLAISGDSGATWNFVDPTPLTAASRVWDVVVQPGGPTGQGILDICGDDGHFRSTDGGGSWTGGAGSLPQGRCSIAVSPDESYVLFVAAADNNIYESDDAGANWTNLGTPDFRRQGRIPFVETNQRSNDATGDRFDLWYSDVSLFRGLCRTPAMPAMGGATRCPTARTGAIPNPYTLPTGWAGLFTRCRDVDGNGCAHDDAGAILFDPEDATDSCPILYSSDGGVYVNEDLGADCQDPNWEQPDVTPHALWLFGMEGVNRAGVDDEDLYFGLQDNGVFGTVNAGAASPSWHNERCCDGFSMAAESDRVLYVRGAFGARGFRLFLAGAGLVGETEINTYPADGLVTTFNFDESVARFGDDSYVVLMNDCNPLATAFDGIDNDLDGMIDEADENNGCSNVNGGDGGVYITTDISASPIVWAELGNATEPPSGGTTDVQVALDSGTPTFYVLAGDGVRRTGGSLWKFTGTGAGAWQRIDNNDGLTGGFNVFAADPNDPDRLYASHMAFSGPQIVFSNDGGLTWDRDTELDNLMQGSGAFLLRTLRGPTNFTGFNGYPQPSLLAFDPEDPDVVVAGGRDSGVFISFNSGADWGVLTDPLNSHTSGVPHLPRPYYAYFDHVAGNVNVFIGTEGRGVWRISIRPPTADANGPYVTDEGVDVLLDGTGSSDPDGAALTYEWDFDDDGDFDDAIGPTPTFDLVGQDGVFVVRLKVTAGGASDVDETTVVVNNVAPSVTLASDAPVNEGSFVTVSGTVTDPGWLELLSATVDWGDGTALESVSGVLENIRPDATLTFGTSHVYGDNGTFSAEVCGSDDDTTTCESIDLPIDNVDPTAEIDESGTVLIGGVPTFLAEAGEPIDFSGRSTDPGSDDLTLTWQWGDGTPSVSTVYLVNPPVLDPFPSPSVQPRDVTDMKTHAFAEACLYTIGFDSLDDDGGASPVDQANVVIVGLADVTRSAGYWRHQFRGNGNTDFDAARLECYLAIVRFASSVFDEVRALGTLADAEEVLDPSQNGGSMLEHLDRQLLAAWLNFANGAIGFAELVDTDGDGMADTSFAEALATAELVRLDPSSTRAELEEQKDILELINTRDD